MSLISLTDTSQDFVLSDGLVDGNNNNDTNDNNNNNNNTVQY